jgi:hypothetical protein
MSLHIDQWSSKAAVRFVARVLPSLPIAYGWMPLPMFAGGVLLSAMATLIPHTGNAGHYKKSASGRFMMA